MTSGRVGPPWPTGIGSPCKISRLRELSHYHMSEAVFLSFLLDLVNQDLDLLVVTDTDSASKAFMHRSNCQVWCFCMYLISGKQARAYCTYERLGTLLVHVTIPCMILFASQDSSKER